MTDSHHPNPEEEMERAEAMKDEEPTKYYAPKMPRRSWSPNPDSETCACHNTITANTLDQRFDEKFTSRPLTVHGIGGRMFVPNPDPTDVKAFIHSEIRNALEGMRSAILYQGGPRTLPEREHNGYGICLVETIKTMKAYIENWNESK